jgi:methionyl-tRNA synthetase
MAADLPLPHHVFVHGYLLMRERGEKPDGSQGEQGELKKMSKSLGNVLDPFEIIETFGADALRYYCFREVSFGQDGAVSVDGFESRYETELANDYGNLASRTVAMIVRYRDGVVPQSELDPEVTKDFDGLPEEIAELLDRAELTQALERIWRRVRRLNRYVEERAPWQQAKDPAQSDELDRTLATLAEGLRSVTVLLHPYLPESTTTLLAALGQERTDYEAARLGAGEAGARVTALAPLFPKR